MPRTKHTIHFKATTRKFKNRLVAAYLNNIISTGASIGRRVPINQRQTWIRKNYEKQAIRASNNLRLRINDVGGKYQTYEKYRTYKERQLMNKIARTEGYPNWSQYGANIGWENVHNRHGNEIQKSMEKYTRKYMKDEIIRQVEEYGLGRGHGFMMSLFDKLKLFESPN